MHIFSFLPVLLLAVARNAASPMESDMENGFKRDAERNAEHDPLMTAASQPEQAGVLSDMDLAKSARVSREAFGELYERHVADIYRYVYYRVGSVEDTEDLTARVFARALKHIHNYNDRGLPFMAWLYRIAHNVVANYHRDSHRHPSVPLDEMDLESGYTYASAHAEDDADAADLRIDNERERKRLIDAIRKLPEERQQLVVLKFVQQLQNIEIGQIMGRSEGAIKSLYHRTLAQLRELMQVVVSG